MSESHHSFLCLRPAFLYLAFMQIFRFKMWVCLVVVLANLPTQAQISVRVLGIAQDAGFPQAGCNKSCCQQFYAGQLPAAHPVSLAIVDSSAHQYWLVEATTDLPQQLHALGGVGAALQMPAGIFLTHAHMGHYAGLLQLGREAMNAQRMPVYAMPRMQDFLTHNGPWSQLLQLQNIVLKPLEHQQQVTLSNHVIIEPLLVPHRDEFSETVGYLLHGPNKKLLFIPDIDKWEKWNSSIDSLIQTVDYALLDATFFDATELPGRNMQEIPHPFVVESMQRFAALPAQEKSKIIFIHFNHTNSLLQPKSAATKKVLQAGFKIATEGMQLKL